MAVLYDCNIKCGHMVIIMATAFTRQKEIMIFKKLKSGTKNSAVAAVVRGLMLTISHQHEIGTLYPQVLETLVRGACRQLF